VERDVPELLQETHPTVPGIARGVAVEVLEQEGHAAEGSLGQRIGVGGRPRLGEEGMDDGVEVRIQPLDARDRGVDRLARRDLLVTPWRRGRRARPTCGKRTRAGGPGSSGLGPPWPSGRTGRARRGARGGAPARGRGCSRAC
jgi:hypothetical protein